jgi:uncharacterized membrane protein
MLPDSLRSFFAVKFALQKKIRDFGDTDSQYGTDIPYTHSPDKHDFDQIDYRGKASTIGYFMAVDELVSTVFTAVILFVLVLFPVSGYGRAMAREAFDVYGDFHAS